MKTRDWCGTYLLDENKNAIPCTTEKWSEQREEMSKNNTKHVAEETIGDYWVSTVWLGLDHQWLDDGPPLIYETMVFDTDHHEIYCSRSSTWFEAEEGHREAVEWVKNGCKHEGERNE